MKRRTKVVALATSLLVGVSMIGVGFATWVISKEATDVANGNIVAETVSEAEIELTAAANGGLYFTAPAKGPNTGKWLSADASEAENLKASITLTLKGVDHINTVFDVKKSEASVLTTDWTAATTTYNFLGAYSFALAATPDGQSGVTNGNTIYQIDSSTGAITVQDKQSVVADTTYTLYVEVTFAWGSHFGGVNPFTYYNEKERDNTCAGGYTYDPTFNANPDSATYGQDALASLKKLEELVNGCKYYFTFTGYSK